MGATPPARSDSRRILKKAYGRHCTPRSTSAAATSSEVRQKHNSKMTKIPPQQDSRTVWHTVLLTVNCLMIQLPIKSKNDPPVATTKQRRASAKETRRSIFRQIPAIRALRWHQMLHATFRTQAWCPACGPSKVRSFQPPEQPTCPSRLQREQPRILSPIA